MLDTMKPFFAFSSRSSSSFAEGLWNCKTRPADSNAFNAAFPRSVRPVAVNQVPSGLKTSMRPMFISLAATSISADVAAECAQVDAEAEARPLRTARLDRAGRPDHDRARRTAGGGEVERGHAHAVVEVQAVGDQRG